MNENEDYQSYPRLKLNQLRSGDLITWLDVDGRLRSGQLTGFSEGWHGSDWKSGVIVAGKKVDLARVVSRRRNGQDLIFLSDAITGTPQQVEGQASA